MVNVDVDDSIFESAGSLPVSASAADLITSLGNNRKMDKSSVLRFTIDFLRQHYEEAKHSEAHLSALGMEQGQATSQVDGSELTNISAGQADPGGFTKADDWKPSLLTHEEFAQLMLEVL